MRREDFDTDKLQNYRLIQRAVCVHNDLQVSDFDLLIYLNPIKNFTIHDFNSGKMTMSWDKTRFYRLIREGWIKKVHSGRGIVGGHNKYATTPKTKIMITKVGRMIDGADIPEIRKPIGYKQKVLNTSIRKYNNLKYEN